MLGTLKSSGRWLLGTAALLIAGVACAQTRSTAAGPQLPLGARIDSFKDILWTPADNYFRSPGPVRITLSGLETGETVILTADDAEGKPDGEIIVRGRLSLRRSDAVLSGTSLRLNAADLTGSLSHAEARVGAIRLRGSGITMAKDRTLIARQGRFTTCSKEHPDFCITAQELRLNARGKVVARGVALELGGRRVLVVPYLEKTFTTKVANPFPIPSYSKETGIKYRLATEFLSNARSSLNLDLVASVRRAPFGAVTWELDPGRPNADAVPPLLRKNALSDPTPDALELFPASGAPPVDYVAHPTVLFAAFGANEYAHHRLRTDLRLSRLPEAGIALYHPALRAASERDGQALRLRTDRASFYGVVAGGYYKEVTTGVTDSRASLRAGAVAPSIHLLPSVSLRAGFDWEGAAYGKGGTYSISSPQAELVWQSRGGTALSAGYRYRAEGGRTPFAFDRLAVKNEVRLRYEGDYVRWGLDLMVAYDADRWRAYDTAVSVLHRLDCLEFGLSYRTRSQGFGVVLNLLPGSVSDSHDKEVAPR